MATILDIANSQIKSSMPIPVPQAPPSSSKVVSRRNDKKISEAQDAANPLANIKDDAEEVARIAEDIKSVVESLNVSVSFSIEKRDARPDIVIAKVIDKDTGDVIRQIPSEEIIELGKRLDEFVGIIFNRKT